MSARTAPAWTLVREFGLEYASDEAEDPLGLCWPASAEKLEDGGHLVVDELAAYNAVPMRIDARTLLFSATGEVTWDSQAQGFHDAYGFAMGRGFGLLRRTRWDLLVLTCAGEVADRVDLAKVSRHLPRIASPTQRGTFLITFLTRSHEFDLVEIDRAGRLLWHLPDSHGPVGVPSSMQLLPNDSILVADSFRHAVLEVRRDGSCATRWGEWAQPSSKPSHLNGPSCARQLEDGSLLVADTHNHRVLSIDPGGDVRQIENEAVPWMMPCSVESLPDGGCLVSDHGNRCVVELDRCGRVGWHAGRAIVRHRSLSFPRSVEYLPEDRYLIADTANNRVLEVDGEGCLEHPCKADPPVFWPRAARKTQTGSLLVADGRNSRVLELAPDGRVLRQLSVLRDGKRTLKLADPHDIRPMPSDHLLITDSAQDLVVEADWEGRIVWSVGLDGRASLKDPHSAQRLEDGRFLIADSGNHRVLLIDPETAQSEALSELRSESEILPLRLPRYVEAAFGALLVVDTGNDRVLASEFDGRLLWQISSIPDSPVPTLRMPRWASLVARNEVLISDQFHHRILHLLREPS